MQDLGGRHDPILTRPFSCQKPVVARLREIFPTGCPIRQRSSLAVVGYVAVTWVTANKQRRRWMKKHYCYSTITTQSHSEHNRRCFGFRPLTHLSSSVEPMSWCPWRWCMAFFAPCGLSKWAIAVPGLLTKIFTYSNMVEWMCASDNIMHSDNCIELVHTKAIVYQLKLAFAIITP